MTIPSAASWLVILGIDREFVAGDAVTRCADMQQQRHIEILRGPPQPLVNRVAIGLVRHRRDGNECAHQTQFLASRELQAGLVDIVDFQHRDALQALRIRPAEIRHPVVVDTADFGPERAVGRAIPEQALARLQARAPRAILFFSVIIAWGS